MFRSDARDTARGSGRLAHLVTVTVFVVAATSAVGAEEPRLAKDTDAVSITAQIVSQRYCGDEKDLVFLQLELSLDARNVTGRKLILSRHPALGQPVVAATPEHGRRGDWEVSWPSGGRYPAESPVFGAEPASRDFVVLSPQEHFSTTVTLGILVQPRWAERLPTAILEDSTHAFSASVDWWAPFVGLTNAEVVELTERWKRAGDVVVGSSRIPWTEFRAPTIPSDTRCPLASPASPNLTGIVRSYARLLSGHAVPTNARNGFAVEGGRSAAGCAPPPCPRR